MLYQIIDRHGKAIGVHECAPRDLWAYVHGLPAQGAPYKTNAPSASLVHKTRIMAQRYRLVGGFVAGAACTETIHAVLRWFT